MAFFSIIIPTYNRATLIDKTIQSILSQTFTDFEIIIIDDGSTDNTEEIIASLKSQKIIYFKKQNAERGAARNTGTKLSKGKFVTFLDSDDLFYSNHLETAFEAITNNKSPEILHTRYEIVTQNGNIVKQEKILDININHKLITGNFMSCNGVFLRKDIALENLFNEDRALSALEDWELWLRIASKYKIYYHNTITSAIVNHDSRSVLNTNKSELINRVNSLMKYVLENEEVMAFYADNIYKFKSSCYTYIALHIALTKKNRTTTIKYTLKGIKENPQSIFSRRFLAILKHFI